MRIYVASSWRNVYQQDVVQCLRNEGHDVYDFRNPPNNTGFGWQEVHAGYQHGNKITANAYRKMLKHPRAIEGYASDLDALKACDWVVYVLPCGRSASWEFGYAMGQGKLGITVVLEPCEPELMFSGSAIVSSLDELRMLPDVYMVHCGTGGSVFVKTYSFFVSQGGLTGLWGQHWRPVIANNLDDAREKGCQLFPLARPYHQQAR